MSNQQPTQPSPSFDQIVKGYVSIKKLSKHKYKITFSKIGKFLLYQVWDKDNAGQQNDKRSVFNVSAKYWVNDFMKQNETLKKDNKPLFTPTTIMETVDKVAYAFVIHKAYFDRHKRVVFTVSTKEIHLANNCSKDLIKIPCGKFKNMRFDIDDSTASACEDATECHGYTCGCPGQLCRSGAPGSLGRNWMCVSGVWRSATINGK